MICKECDNKVSRYQITNFKKNEKEIHTYYGCSKCDIRWEEHTTEAYEDGEEQ